MEWTRTEAPVAASVAALDDDAAVALRRTAWQELEEKTRDTRFATAICALTVLRYVTDAMGDLPLGVMARLLDTHDAQTPSSARRTNADAGPSYNSGGRDWSKEL